MSYGRFVELYCDGPGESGGVGRCSCALAEGYGTVTEARAGAREQGWTHRNGRDLCPECSAREKEKS